MLPRGTFWRSCCGSGKVSGFILFLSPPDPPKPCPPVAPWVGIVLLFWSDLTKSPSFHLGGDLRAESRTPWIQRPGERGQKKMTDALRVSITCPAISCLMIVLSSPPLPAELTISLMCGWIEVRVLVGGQDSASSWFTGRCPARPWYICVWYVWYVYTHALSCRTHKFHTWPGRASLSLQPNWCSKGEVQMGGVNGWQGI